MHPGQLAVLKRRWKLRGRLLPRITTIIMEQEQGSGEPGLEDRLRNMILTNSNDPEPQVKDAPSGPSPPQPRKRLNQAQRRQMSAQLNIAIDPRAQPSEPAGPQPTLRGFAPHPEPPAGQHQIGQRFGHQGEHQPGRQPGPYGHGGRYRNQRPQSGPQIADYHQQAGPRAHQSNQPHTGNQVPVQPQGHQQSRHHPSRSYHGPGSQHLDRNASWRQPPQSAFNRNAAHHTPQGSFDGPAPRNARGGGLLWNPGGRQSQVQPEQLKAQADLLEGLCATIIANAQIEYDDIVKNETFRQRIETLAQDVITQYEQTQNGFYDFPPQSVQLRCFGSLASGFATKAADMDLGLLSPLSKVQPDAPGSPIPRLIEKAFLEVGLAARLLSKTRVPIIKVCEKPPKSLYDDLVEEHLKQEKGMVDNGEEEEENDEPEHEVAEDVDDEADEPAGGVASAGKKQQQNQQKEQKDDTQGQSNNLPDNGEENTDDNRTKKQGWKIFQSRNQTLNSYYGAAKGYLRSVGGRDLTNSGIHSFSPRDYEKLNQVCLTFVEGLEDHQLRDRLFSYKSLNRYDLEYRPDLPRTLQGVFTQVEGEQMVMMWESRQITEKDADKEARGQTCVHRWKTLQDHPNPGFDPLQYDRDLKRAADQLRLLPSIQVMLLSQQQHESTAQYCNRAEKLIVELVGDDPADRREKIALISKKYVSGIKDEAIREAVREFAENFGYADSKGIAKRHMSYQLAHDLEVCLGRNLYPKYTEEQIRSYIAFLRGPIVRSPVEPFECDFETPLSPDLIKTIAQIREVGDPSAMGPNQPRDPYRDRFEFPKSGVGIQCDINFSAHLAMHNTHLLRCYSSCDPRVRPMVLFVKHWAKVRGINSPYRGTLSSYGYVMMVLHYLINVVKPFVCPNLQQLALPLPPDVPPQQLEDIAFCKGRNVQFWRDDQEIQRLAAMGMINQNRDSIGHLLRGFFEYYAQNGSLSTLPGRGFDWGRDVISLRTPGGILSKQKKGWTGAKTVLEVKPGVPSTTVAPSGQQPQQPVLPNADALGMPPLPTGVPVPAMGPPPGLAPPPGFPPQPQGQTIGPVPPSPVPPATTSVVTEQPPKAEAELKEVRYRYLFAIEDPFELEHNVARTVTHSGIVAIRDEFRRAWRIIRNAGRPQQVQQGQGHQGFQQQGHQGQGRQGQETGEEMPVVQEEENLLEDVLEAGKKKQGEHFDEVLDGLHGKVWRGEDQGVATSSDAADAA